MPPAEWSQKKSDLALAEHRHWQDARHAFAHVPRWYQASYPQSAWRGALHAPAIDSALPKFAHMLEKTAGTHHSDAFGMNMTRANDLLNASDGIRERLPEEHGAFCPPIRTSCSDKGNATSPRETTISEATTSPTCVEDIESYDPPSPSLAAASEPDDVDMENEAEVDKEADVEAEVEAENEDESKPKLKGRGKARKRSRYLRELDRRVILERLFRGEKQVVLAKEYNVSRAAICNLYKHRDEVLARTHEDPLAKHPKKRKPLCDGRPRRVRCRLSAGPPSPLGANALVQVQSDAILLQLTVLSDRRTAPHDFRRGMERLLWLFLEEALSLVPIKFTHVSVGENGATSHGAGVATEHPPCVISMEHHARSPMLSVVQSIDPAIPVGWVQEAIHAGTATTTLFPARQLPTTLKYHNVFLLDVAIFDWQQLCDRIACVKQHGALEVMLYVVVLFTSRWLIDRVRREFPNVHFVALHASSSWQPPAMDSPLAHVDLLLSRLDQVYETHYGIDDSETA